MSKFLPLIGLEFKMLARQSARLLMGIFFSLFCYVIFHLLLGSGQVSMHLFAAIFMMLNVFNVINFACAHFSADMKSGFLVNYYVTCRKLNSYCSAKLISFLIISLLMMISALIIGALLFSLDSQIMFKLFLIGTLQIALLSIVSLVCAAFLINNSSQVYIYVLILPFVVPSVVLSALSVDDINHVKIMVGLLLIYIPTFWIIMPLLLKQQLYYDN